MIITKVINVTPLGSTIGKIIPMDNTAFFLLENFRRRGMENIIDKFYNMITEKIALVEPNVNHLISFLTILDTVLTRNTPVVLPNLIDMRVKELKRGSRNLEVVVEYEFE